MANINYIEKHLKTFTVKMHKHACWEIVYVTDGCGKFELEDGSAYPYQKGDVICIPPDLFHKNVSDSGFKNLHLTIEDFQFQSDRPILLKKNENTKSLAKIMEIAYKYLHMLPLSSALNFSLSNAIVSFLEYLLRPDQLSPVTQTLVSVIINNYTDVNFNLDTAYEKVSYSKEYARKIFLKDLHITPTKFLINKRIELAKQLLSDRKSNSYNIREIAESCGFPDQLYFSRIFKKETGVAPTDYKVNSLENNKIFDR